MIIYPNIEDVEFGTEDANAEMQELFKNSFCEWFDYVAIALNQEPLYVSLDKQSKEYKCFLNQSEKSLKYDYDPFDETRPEDFIISGAYDRLEEIFKDYFK